ncbi:hypothetical protein Tco_1532924 [Tanacetum coccineum]
MGLKLKALPTNDAPSLFAKFLVNLSSIDLVAPVQFICDRGTIFVKMTGFKGHAEIWSYHRLSLLITTTSGASGSYQIVGLKESLKGDIMEQVKDFVVRSPLAEQCVGFKLRRLASGIWCVVISHLDVRMWISTKAETAKNDKTEHGMEITVQNQGQSPKMTKSESI